MSLVIYLKNGNTLMFEQVTNFNDNGSEVHFKYHGVSTDTSRTATFIKNNIAGYAPSK